MKYYEVVQKINNVFFLCDKKQSNVAERYCRLMISSYICGRCSSLGEAVEAWNLEIELNDHLKSKMSIF